MVLYLIILMVGQIVRFVVDYLIIKMVCSMNLMDKISILLRRSSVQQLTGTVNVISGSNILSGTDTNFSGQLSVGGRVVIRGGSYKITHIPDKTYARIQPVFIKV